MKSNMTWMELILSGLYFFLSFIIVHTFWLGPPFESLMSIITILYLSVCFWIFPSVLHILEDSKLIHIRVIGYVLFEFLSLVLFLIAPIAFVYTY